MKSMMKLSAIFFCFALTACSDDPAENNGTTNNGSNNGSNNGPNNGSNNGPNNGSNNGPNNGTTGTNNGGGLNPGDACDPNDTCTDGYCAITDFAADPCVGVCEAFLALADDCSAGVCEFPALACQQSDTTCVTRGADGEACETGTCELALFCVKAAAADPTGTCGPKIAEGEQCPQFFGCVDGIYCDTANTTCTAPTLNEGEDCSALPQGCISPNTCDFAGDMTCKAPVNACPPA